MLKIALQPVANYGDWQVMPNGTLRNAKRHLTIAPDRLTDPNWWLTFRALPWVRYEWNDFIPAFFEACEYAGLEKVEIKIETF